ncbi:ATP-dependent DNA helicase [Ignatzschineria rhizosphaerae]|uniref:DNA 5'-3' helicase n=1 Tax=Ignatzschineria rhizosphaerae TaxID=2923279 RepID=A0ABY3X5Y7_9GAMM|nr:ATP-dependent DNA helicase [Ignatzschineria rhizosphaerae]UNM96457.1 ATP-dependent DNA helicase [Ignatzschineria rhizosphaerae]
MNRESITHFFADGGNLSLAIEGYQPRDEQIKMAKAIAEAIEEHDTLIVEAGTGTGKTFAYLVPALLSKRKTLISTGTKHLQDQLFEKDIPLLKGLIKHPISTALLKGRSNYLCLYRTKTLRARGRFENKKQVEQFFKIERFAGQDATGDITQLSGITETELWPQVTSTTENCLHNECPDFEECFVFKARKKAMDSDVVVINHHLLCADLALKQDGFGEILPEAEIIIIDEAHQLAETAGLFFSTQLSTKQFHDWIDDLNKAIAVEAADFSGHDTAADALFKALTDLRKALPQYNQRYALSEFEENPIITGLFQEIYDIAKTILSIVDPLKIRAQIFLKLVERLEEIIMTWKILLLSEKTPDSVNAINWLETYTFNITFHSTPLDISEQFRKNSGSLNASWIFTSATLAVKDDFSYFCRPLGLSKKNTLKLDSPFDYPRTSLLYHPDHLPLPSDPKFLPEMIDAVLPVIDIAKGRSFILFTSYRALNEAKELLKKKTAYPLFVQGDMPKMQLIEAFKASGNGILLGTMSFWEGVDVKGDALSCVIIEKFPFSSPGDPIEQAKMDLIREQGYDPFSTYQLPKAIIALKQGVGRLIRDHDDYGVLVIADTRLSKSRYGKRFLDSLPPMTKTLKPERITRFFDYMENKRETSS